MEITTFSENVRHLRELENQKQSEVADSIGFSVQKWNNYEREISYPKLEDLEVISNYFGIIETDLLHAELPESDLRALYNRYIHTQKQPFEIGNTPRAKSFFQYFKSLNGAIPPVEKGSSVTKSVTKPVTNAPKNTKKPFIYGTVDAGISGMELREEGAEYNATSKKPAKDDLSGRIDVLEGVLRQLKAVLSQSDL